MPEKLEIKVLEGIVWASVSGRFSLENAKEFLLEILRRARAEGINKILIDARGITAEISTIARLEFGNYLVAENPYHTLIAIVGNQNAVWPDRFLENVLVNRDIDAKVVTEIKEALEWLTE